MESRGGFYLKFLFQPNQTKNKEMRSKTLTFDNTINPLPTEPLPTWDTEAFVGIFEGFRRNITTIFWIVLCPKHLLVIEGNYQTFQKKYFLHDLVT
jgi:hypothetical protein